MPQPWQQQAAQGWPQQVPQPWAQQPTPQAWPSQPGSQPAQQPWAQQPWPPQPQPGYYQQPAGYQPQPQPSYYPQPVGYQPMPQPGYYPQPPQPVGYQPAPVGYQPVPYPYQQTYARPTYAYPSPPTAAAVYKKKLRRVILLIVLAAFLFYLVNTAATIVVFFGHLVSSGTLEEISSLIQHDPFAAQKLIWDTLQSDALPYGLASIVGIAVGSLMMLLVRGKRMFTTDLTQTNSRINVKTLIMMAGIILGFNALISLLPLLLDPLLQMLDVSSEEPVIDPFIFYLNVPGILYVVVLGPIFEEIIFRGAVLRSLQPYGNNFAIVLSSILFGVYHLVLFQGVFAFFVGLVLAYCTLRFSIKWSMLLHILNNAFAMTLLYTNPDMLILVGIYLLLLVLALIAGILGFKAFREQLQTGRPTSIAFVTGIPLDVFGQSGQPGYPGQFGQPYQQPAPAAVARARPFAISFSSAWLIIALALAFFISISGALFT
jgi:membrane protease YdiL (CAAX protease family)